MGYDSFWDEYELFFYHEFINDESFSVEKKAKLKHDGGCFFINGDFTIYQEKSKPFEHINETDFIRNFTGFIKILFNIPPIKVEQLLNFHFEKYTNDKEQFLKFLYHEMKGSKTTQGDKILPPPQNKLILFEWCENKMNSSKFITNQRMSNKTFVNINRIEEIKKLRSNNFDFSKLVKLLEEVNDNFSLENYYSVSFLSRAVVDHIPPIFKKENFTQVANNYGGSSIKRTFKRLNDSMKTISDIHLHGQIRKSEPKLNLNQIDYSQEFDFLLSEIITLTLSEN